MHLGIYPMPIPRCQVYLASVLLHRLVFQCPVACAVVQQKEAHDRFAELRLAANDALRRCATSPTAPLVPLPAGLEAQLGAKLAPGAAQEALVSVRASLSPLHEPKSNAQGCRGSAVLPTLKVKPSNPS